MSGLATIKKVHFVRSDQELLMFFHGGTEFELEIVQTRLGLAIAQRAKTTLYRVDPSVECPLHPTKLQYIQGALACLKLRREDVRAYAPIHPMNPVLSANYLLTSPRRHTEPDYVEAVWHDVRGAAEEGLRGMLGNSRLSGDTIYKWH